MARIPPIHEPHNDERRDNRFGNSLRRTQHGASHVTKDADFVLARIQCTSPTSPCALRLYLHRSRKEQSASALLELQCGQQIRQVQLDERMDVELWPHNACEVNADHLRGFSSPYNLRDGFGTSWTIWPVPVAARCTIGPRQRGHLSIAPTSRSATGQLSRRSLRTRKKLPRARWMTWRAETMSQQSANIQL